MKHISSLILLSLLLGACSKAQVSETQTCLATPYAEVAPVGPFSLNEDSFWVDATEVTNAQFQAFVEAEKYTTVAERWDKATNANWGSAVFTVPTTTRASWWRLDPDANWRQPGGAGSDLKGKENHPVVHITYEDALAYAAWAGGDLPTQEEWEFAARQGSDGNDKRPGPEEANTWQGVFPISNEVTDGHDGVAPVGCYASSPTGLYDMIGNVWEWTRSEPGQELAAHGWLVGGSHLCSDNFCRNYTPSGRQRQELNFSASHIGFRVIYRNDPSNP